jgi:hypothetical protein
VAGQRRRSVPDPFGVFVDFFLPPPGSMGTPLADSGVPAVQLYSALLGDSLQLEAVDERLEQLELNIPRTSTRSWPCPWRPERRLVPQLARALSHLAQEAHCPRSLREYGDQLDDPAKVLAGFAARIKTFGSERYLQSKAHRDGETPLASPAEPEM